MNIDPSVQDWMVVPETVAIMRLLNKGTEEPKALFVGGCVRNALLGYSVDDIDIATQWTPQEVMVMAQKAGYQTIPTGIDHGTVMVVINHKSFEITTLRKDVETDGRHAVVAFTKDWLEDAQRRDFTMNTLLADSDGHIYDPTGQGLADLESGRICFVGEPADRIAEDYLRILRFFRFHALYGSGDMDEQALKACVDASDKIETLSRERITHEFLKILGADNPVPVLTTMFERGILSELPASSYQSNILHNIISLQRENSSGILARLIVLAGFQAEHIKTMEKWLVFSNAQKREMNEITAALEILTELNERTVKTALYRHGLDHARQAVLLSLAKNEQNDIPDSIRNIFDQWQIPDFPLTGEDILNAGIEAGPAIGQILKSIEEWWIEEDFQPDRAACLERLQGFIEDSQNQGPLTTN